MVSLRDEGCSYGEIGEKLFDSFGYSLDARDIRKLIKKKKERRED